MTPRMIVNALGAAVLAARPVNGLFDHDNNVEDQEARHPGRGERADNPKFDGHTWEFYLGQNMGRNNGRNKGILIVLSFNVRRLDPRSQSITLGEYHFENTRLFIYDTQKPDGAAITPQQLVDKMIGKIPAARRGNGSYSIEPSAKKICFAKSEVGHVLNLYILGDGDLNIPGDMDPKQLRTVSESLVRRIATALTDLLPVAEYYAQHR
ncbi:MAG: hypothetical protein J6A21_09955, partial [Lentisphaeria bacterium]|nr:hypothetical protein [Lentisphaeria bacterium]